MPRSTKPRKRYRPAVVAANAVQVALSNVRTLARQDVAGQQLLLRTALDEFRRGRDCPHHWRSLADCANVAETLAALGIGAGEQAAQVINAAQRVLHDVAQRHATRRTWALRHDEADALAWLLRLHAVQLEHCDYGEFRRALDITHNRIAQARAGNAPAGAIIVEGEIA